MKVERWLCDVCYACEDEPWHGKQYFTEKDEVEHVVTSHKWIQKCVDAPDGSSLVLRYLRDLNEFHELLLLGNNTKGVRFLTVAEIMNIDPFKGPGWYYFSNDDKENPESRWKLNHIEDMRTVEDRKVERLEQATECARLTRQEVYIWVGKENEKLNLPTPPEWPVSEEEAPPLPVLP
jgi:hypothetical protein